MSDSELELEIEAPTTPHEQERIKKHIRKQQRWDILDLYFETHGIVDDQIRAFDVFVFQDIKACMDSLTPLEVETENILEFETEQIENGLPTHYHRYTLTTGACKIGQATHKEAIDNEVHFVFPEESRLRDIGSAAPLYCDIVFRHEMKAVHSSSHPEDESSKKKQKLVEPTWEEVVEDRCVSEEFIGKIPIMTRSKRCTTYGMSSDDLVAIGEDPRDPGGYFVVKKGGEKVVVTQEAQAHNTILCLAHKHHKYAVTVQSKVPTRAPSMTEIYTAKPKGLAQQSPDYLLLTRFNRKCAEKKPVSLVLLLIVLGMPFEEISHNICWGDPDLEDMLRPTMDHALEILERLGVSESQLFGLHTSENFVDLQKTCLGEITRHCVLHMDKKVDRMKTIVHILTHEFLCHVSQQESSDAFVQKAWFMCAMARRGLMVLTKKIPENDRDAIASKRFVTGGENISNSFQKCLWKVWNKDLRKEFLKTVMESGEKGMRTKFKIKPLVEIIHKSVTTTMRKIIKKGVFGFSSGVTQTQERHSPQAALSHLCKINNPINKQGTSVSNRQVRGNQTGFICIAETPEGQSIGGVKTKACTSSFTLESPVEPVLECIHGVTTVYSHESCVDQGLTQLYINGNWLGGVKNPERVLTELRIWRSQGTISRDAGFSLVQKESYPIGFDVQHSPRSVANHRSKQYVCNELHVRTSAGRMKRPLMVVFENSINLCEEDYLKIRDKKITWEEMIKRCIVEYVDVEEQATLLIAQDERFLQESTLRPLGYEYTHMEIHGVAVYGIGASMIPFSNHSQSPRIGFQSQQFKQALGIVGLNYRNMFLKTFHLLHYPQKPLVTTVTSKHFGVNDLPCGVNLLVWWQCWTGYNQEDSFIIKRQALERGAFDSTIFRTFTDTAMFQEDQMRGESNKQHETREDFGVPDKKNTLNMRFRKNALGGNPYAKLESDGLVAPGTRITENDVLAGKQIEFKTESEAKTSIVGRRGKGVVKKDTTCLVYNYEEPAIVDRVMKATNGDGYKTVKIRTLSKRGVLIGDKFSSRHGQKGTAGMIRDECDMPRDHFGNTPDIIMNPHAFPSRMTVGMVMEQISSQNVAYLGTKCPKTGKPLFGDGTPFEELDLKEMMEILKDSGRSPFSTFPVWCGETGEKMANKVFGGDCFFQRLKHMVTDKIYARKRGPVDPVTRQAVQGRARKGGLRIGGMEKDSMMSYGASEVVRDRMLTHSDNTFTAVCDHCGVQTIANDYTFRLLKCSNSDCLEKHATVSRIQAPQAMALLSKELASCGIMTVWRGKK
ncbi:MAG: DNA-directed RNA polymerase subunit beta [Promethearchaeota archaeon]